MKCYDRGDECQKVRDRWEAVGRKARCATIWKSKVGRIWLVALHCITILQYIIVYYNGDIVHLANINCQYCNIIIYYNGRQMLPTMSSTAETMLRHAATALQIGQVEQVSEAGVTLHYLFFGHGPMVLKRNKQRRHKKILQTSIGSIGCRAIFCIFLPEGVGWSCRLWPACNFGLCLTSRILSFGQPLKSKEKLRKAT